MIYADSLKFATPDDEVNFFYKQKLTCYDTHYPFQVFPQKGFRQIDFSDITILYGGNGSGKSTALNLIANKKELWWNRNELENTPVIDVALLTVRFSNLAVFFCLKLRTLTKY